MKKLYVRLNDNSLNEVEYDELDATEEEIVKLLKSNEDVEKVYTSLKDAETPDVEYKIYKCYVKFSGEVCISLPAKNEQDACKKAEHAIFLDTYENNTIGPELLYFPDDSVKIEYVQAGDDMIMDDAIKCIGVEETDEVWSDGNKERYEELMNEDVDDLEEDEE